MLFGIVAVVLDCHVSVVDAAVPVAGWDSLVDLGSGDWRLVEGDEAVVGVVAVVEKTAAAD